MSSQFSSKAIFAKTAPGRNSFKDVCTQVANVYKAKYENGAAKYAELFVKQMREEILKKQWSVPFGSLRYPRPGSKYYVPPGLRDIKETGRLLTSFYVQTRQGNGLTTFEFGSSVPHVNAVRFGYVTRGAIYSPRPGEMIGNKMPGRDFVAAARKNLPFSAFMRDFGATRLTGSFTARNPVTPPTSYDSPGQ